MRHYAQRGQFHYVTLGGTELRDIQSIHYVDDKCAAGIVSFESKKNEYELACGTRDRVHAIGLTVDVRHGDIFTFERIADGPHLFFIDLKGSCVLSDYHEKFADLMSANHIRAGDALLITSHLGARRGWVKLLNEYTDELDTLQVVGHEQRKLCFRRSHTSFTLFRALHRIRYQDAIELRCFGCIEYRDKSPMSIFGYTVAEGTTRFSNLVNEAPYFHVRRGLHTP